MEYTLMNENERVIMAAHGYLELGMFRQVWEELQTLPAELLGRSDVIEILVLSLMGEKRWDEALKLAQHLRSEMPGEPSGFIHEAFCLHELGRTREALDLLLQGPPILRGKAIFFYNVGCYHARLGEYKKAMSMLEQSFKMDASFKKSARRDPDLAGMKEMF